MPRGLHYISTTYSWFLDGLKRTRFGPYGAPMKAALYVRTSTVDQTVDNQVRELEAIAERLGHEVVEVYADNGISGAKGRDRRPAFDLLCRDATRAGSTSSWPGRFDRLGRSLQDLVAFLSEIHASHVELYLHQQGLDTTTRPAGPCSR